MRRSLSVPIIVASFTVWVATAQQNQSEANPVFLQLFQAGRDALQAGRNKDALDAFKKANKFHKNSCADCYVNMAIACLRMGDLRTVVEDCDKAIAVAGDDSTRATAHSLKGKALLGLSQSDGKNLREAEAEDRTAAELDKGDPVLHLNLALALLRQSKDDEAREELKKCLALNPPKAISDQAQMMISDPRRGREDFAPDFHVNTLQGQDIALKQLSGKVVVLDFWATWCPPCRASVPELKDLTRKYASDKVVLISVSGDKDEKAWRDFIAKKDMSWPQYRDSDGVVAKSFAVHVFPTYLVIDGDGIIKQRIVGMDPQETVVHRLKETLRSMPQLEGESAR